MDVLTTRAQVARYAAAHHGSGRRIGFVPTMGALHAGHLALMGEAGRRADVVLASIFVNPTQFGPGEDFERYPRDTEGDLAKARAAGCHAVFLPPVAEMYPPGAETVVRVPALAGPLCGASRPGHFDGVCTVVLKLLNITRCDVAVFGEKDYQQLAVIRRMVRDLDVPVEIVGHPIVREPDGVAMSSRNQYLGPEERREARCLHRALAAAEVLWAAGERDPDALEETARALIGASPRARIDYLEVRDAFDLSRPAAPITAPVVLAMAVWFGQTRLLDNRVLG
ncbi:MAG: pantoate--beta-alanine ligase [bacterium]